MKRERHLIAKDALGSIEQEVFRPETPQERSEALALTLGAKPKGWGIRDEIAEIRDLIDIALHGMGWPRAKERIAVDQNGDWRPIASPDDLNDNEKHKWSFLWIADAAEPLSEAYFLGKISFEIESIEQAIEKNDLLTIFRNAGRLGMYQTEIDVRRVALRYAEKGKRFTGKNTGTQKKTEERSDFINNVSEEISSNNREAIAATCISSHAGRVRQLWGAQGEKARSKLLSFMKNNKVP